VQAQNSVLKLPEEDRDHLV